MSKRIIKHFTLIELLVVISIIAILAALVLPQLNKAQIAANRATSNSNVKALVSAVIAETGMSKGSTYRGLWANRVWTISEEMWYSQNIPSGPTAYDFNLTPQQSNFKAIYEEPNNISATPFSSTNLPTYAINVIAPTTLGSQNDESIIEATFRGNPDAGTPIAIVGTPQNINGATNNQAFEKTQFEVFSTYNANHPFGGIYMYDGRIINFATNAAYSNLTKRKLSTTTRIIGEFYPPDDGDSLGAIGFADGHVSNIKLREFGALPNNTAIMHFGTISGNILGASGEVVDESWLP